eukprot:COSAG02_NODE_11173_length_1776_cov_11.271914_1_plen_139_part_00
MSTIWQTTKGYYGDKIQLSSEVRAALDAREEVAYLKRVHDAKEEVEREKQLLEHLNDAEKTGAMQRKPVSACSEEPEPELELEPPSADTEAPAEAMPPSDTSTATPESHPEPEAAAAAAAGDAEAPAGNLSWFARWWT